jgi:hypothetical protein
MFCNSVHKPLMLFTQYEDVETFYNVLDMEAIDTQLSTNFRW